MARLGEGLIGVNLREGFTLSKHLLQAEQVPVDTLAVSSPSCILKVAGYSSAKQLSTVFILPTQIDSTPVQIRIQR
jgi:hypothetical protein